MKKILSLLILAISALSLAPTSTSAQSFTPPASAIYLYNTGTSTWGPATGTGTTGALPYTPPSYAAYCYNTGTSQWVAATTAGNCFGGGGGSGTVTSFSFTNGGGFLGTVTNSTTTPTLALTVDSTHFLPTNTGPATTYLNGAGAYSTPVGAAPGGTPNQLQYQINSTTFGGYTPSGDCTVNTSTGVTTCLKTNGAAFAAIATSGSAGDLTTGTVAPARLPAATPTVQGAVTTNAFVSHQPWPYGGPLWGFGDSTMYGCTYGNPYTTVAGTSCTTFFWLTAGDYGGTPYNMGAVGAESSEIAQMAARSYQKPVTNLQLPAILTSDGVNDAFYVGASAGALKNYSLATGFIMSWLGLPQTQEVMAGASPTTGTWGSNIGGFILQNISYGTAKQSTTPGDTMTITIPSTLNTAGVVGLNYYAYAGLGTFNGTFTVSIGGVLQTSSCTGTTTFTAYGCGGADISNNGALGTLTGTVFHDRFRVTPGTSVAMLITNTSTGSGSAATIGMISGDANSNDPTLLPLINAIGVIYENGDANSASTLAYYNAYKTVATQFISDGYRITYVDPRTGSPGVNSSTDMTNTTFCPNTAVGLHMNYCGNIHMYQTIVNAANANNLPFTVPGSGRLNGVFSGGIYLAGGISTPYGNGAEGPYTSTGNLDIYTGIANDTSAGGQSAAGITGYGHLGTALPFSVGGSGLSRWVPYHVASSPTMYGPAYQSNGIISGLMFERCTTAQGTSCPVIAFDDLATGIRARGIGASIASASTIAPAFEVTQITGTSAISTVTVPGNCNVAASTATVGFSCSLTFIPTAASGPTFSLATGGNIAYAMSSSPNVPVRLDYIKATGLWYPSQSVAAPSTITASATPAIDATKSLQTITLNANATPTISAFSAGQRITFQICQPATGGPFTWTWPAAVHGGMTVGATASTCSMQSFDSFNGTTFVPESTGITLVAP